VGCVTHVERAVWVESRKFSIADAKSYPRVMQIAFGRRLFNTTHPMVCLGKNMRPSNLDMQCLNNSFYLDGEAIVEEGRIVQP